MTQPTLFDGLGTATRQRRSVPASSVEAWQALSSKDARMAMAVEATRLFPHCTSAELAWWYFQGGQKPTTDQKLTMRRGLSDAKARGLVEHAGKRICRVAGTLAVTWKIRSR